MKPGLLICFEIFLFLISCTSKQAGTITPNEDKGIKEILLIYGGECKYGFYRKTIKAKKVNGFWLELRKIDPIQPSELHPEMIGSNAAFIFFKNLKEERAEYTEIRVTVHFGSANPSQFIYPAAELARILKRWHVAEKTFSMIRNRDFESLSDHIDLDTTITYTPKDSVINNIREAEEQFGNINEFVPYGFKVQKTPDGRELIKFLGVLIRESGKDQSPISIIMDLKSNEEKISAINYTF